MSFGRAREHRATARYRCGDTVTIRGLDEILATLDADGAFEGLPFMPEMAKFCGRTFRVHRRAERTCVEGADGPRRMESTVLLDGLRCDGSAHDGCQRGCLFFWKEAWLRPASEATAEGGMPSRGSAAGRHVLAQPCRPNAARCDGMPHDECEGIPHDDFGVGDPVAALPTMQGNRYYCQSTELAKATAELAPGNLRYYLRDLMAGETSVRRVIHMFWIAFLGFIWRRWYKDEYYRRPIGPQKRTASVETSLEPGELVEVRSAEEIRATLDSAGRNRGLTFEPEMLRHCGRRYRVLMPLKKIISETSGRMISVRNTVVLQGVACLGICIQNCPRANYFYWREAWLKRVPEGAGKHDGLSDPGTHAPAGGPDLVLAVPHCDVDPLAANLQAHDLQA